MAYITISSGLTIKVPTRGTRNWADEMLAQTFTKISSHDHTGSGKGLAIGTNALSANAVTFAKMQTIATNSLLGRDTAGTGNVENITLGTGLQMSGSGVLELTTAASLPSGMLAMFGGAAAPTGWLLCDGSAVSRTTYATLFGIVSTAFGVGDGSTTFNLPDLRQRFPLGKAASGTGATLGGTGGNIDHVHTGPSHTHDLTGGFAKVDYDDGANTLLLEMSTETSTFDTKLNMAAFTETLGSLATTRGVELGGTADASGTGNTGTANPPFQAVNFIIKT